MSRPAPALYFAYGSNLDLEQMRSRCPGAEPLGAARLPAFRLTFAGSSPRWDAGGVATLLPSSESSVFGFLFRLSGEDLAALDGFESNYLRTEETVQVGSTPHRAWVYVRSVSLPFNPPSPRYAAVMAHAYRRLGWALEGLLAALRLP